MKKLFTQIAIAVAGFTGVAVAQQDPQFTQFMHNKLIYNAGYAGTSGAMCGNIQFRQQWSAFEGAPQTIALGFDMPLAGLPLGIGLNVISDKIGPMNTLFLRVPISYNKVIGKGTLGVGLDVGILQKKIDNTWITPEPGKVDPNIPGAYDALSNPALNKLTYDLGFGAFYQIPGKMYVGLSSSHLPAQVVKGAGNLSYEMSRHYYLMAGYSLDINPRNKITPNIKMKSDVAATAVDVNLTYMYDNMLWVGGTYRVSDAAALMIGYQGKSATGGLSYKIGYSYDITLSKLKGNVGGTHEIILGFCMLPKVKKLSSYGDDRFLN
ncbi:MAG: type IX secretion system membrane protein PorP/SprF [Bacteroidota bacterium]|nr:type IX secretion system membrane protein PorP/SprF [Bacteroidota bacterium]